MKTILAMAAAASFAAAAAQAQVPPEASTVRVNYGDLELSRAAGRMALEDRVRAAVRRVCQPRPSPNDLVNLGVYLDCKKQTWTHSRRQLAAIYGGGRLAKSEIRVAAATN